VYGDTDSLFILLRGKTKEQAFRIGHDIADSVTLSNPSPIKLKFEKVECRTFRTIRGLTGEGLSPLRFNGQETIRRFQVRKPR
jgi:hypothetical protein